MKKNISISRFLHVAYRRILLSIVVVLSLHFLSSCQTAPENIKDWADRETLYLDMIDADEREAANELLKHWLVEDLSVFDYDFPKLSDNIGFTQAVSPDNKLRIISWDTQLTGYPTTWFNVIYYVSNGQIFVLSDNEMEMDEKTLELRGSGDFDCRVSEIRQVKTLDGEKVYLTEGVVYDSSWVFAYLTGLTIKDDKLYHRPEMFITSDNTIQNALECSYNNSDWCSIKEHIINSDTEFLYSEDSNEILVPMDGERAWPSDRYERMVFNGTKFIYTDIVADNRLHPSLHDYKNLEGLFLTENHLIRVDKMSDGSYRYASWKRTFIPQDQLTMEGEPALVVGGGVMDEDDNYIFRNGSYEYKVNVYGSDEWRLTIKQHGNIIYQDRDNKE